MYSLLKSTSKDAMHSELVKNYLSIQESLVLNILNSNVSYDSPVNFNESMITPIHRWFPYKEGFSPSFVSNFINEHIKNPCNVKMLDPFSGVGTSPIVACQLGGRGLGFDVNPLSNFVSRVKSIRADKNELKELNNFIQMFKKSKLNNVARKPNNDTVNSYFEDDYLEALLSVKSWINSELKETKYHSLFKLAFLSQIEHFSTHRKAGNGQKRKRNLNYIIEGLSPKKNVQNKVVEFLNIYLADLENTNFLKTPEFIMGSSSEIKNLYFSAERRFNCVLTSPPYANCFDYSKIYMCELWLGDFFESTSDQKAMRMNSIRSHVHATWPERNTNFESKIISDLIVPELESKELWSNKIPGMLNGYFKDLGHILSEIYPYLENGTPVGLVVGNSVYGEVPVATDLIIADMAERYGYEVKSIDVYRNVVVSSQQYIKLKHGREFMRESLVTLRKV